MSKFVMPNLNKEEKRIPISSVVLSSQRVNMRDALFTAGKDKGAGASTNPLVQEGQKLIPCRCSMPTAWRSFRSAPAWR